MQLRSTRLTAISSAVKKLFSPANLFNAGEQGVWYDPSDMSTMFQDAAGTTPVTAVEQPVGRILDKSGRGNHATQTTTTSRPVLSAKVNLFKSTTTLSSWLREGISFQTNQSGFNNSSTAVLISEQASTGRHQTIQFDMGTHIAGSSGFIYKARLKSAGTPWVLVNSGFLGQDGSPNYSDIGFFVNLLTGAIGARYGSSVLTPTVNSLGDGWWEVIVKANISGRYSVQAGLYLGSADNTLNYTGDVNKGVLVDGLDIRVANESTTIPSYQRVNTATDYDTAGFPHYLRFDGVDDWLVTPSIDFTSTDKMTVFAGVRKLSDSTTAGILAELSTNSTSTNGSFLMSANDAGRLAYVSYSKGTEPWRFAASPLSYYAPDSRVLRLTSDISGSLVTLGVNGVQVAQDTSSQGTGNYGNYPLYIGRRAGTTFPFNGHLYSLIVRGAQSTAQQIAQAEQLVNGKTRAY